MSSLPIHPGRCTRPEEHRAFCLAHAFSLMKDALREWDYFENYILPTILGSEGTSISLSQLQYSFLCTHKRFMEAVLIHGLPHTLDREYDEITSELPKFFVSFDPDSGKTVYRPLIITSDRYTSEGYLLFDDDENYDHSCKEKHLVMLPPRRRRF